MIALLFAFALGNYFFFVPVICELSTPSSFVNVFCTFGNRFFLSFFIVNISVHEFSFFGVMMRDVVTSCNHYVAVFAQCSFV